MKRLLLMSAVTSLACAHSREPDIATLASSSDQIIWEAGQKAAQKKQWESARQHYKRIIDAFPQSRFGPGARLALADSHFQEGGAANYVLAISEYRDFLTLYPSHPQSDYAQFRVGECFFRQRNGPDRDQTYTDKALEEFQRLLDIYPNSSYGDTVRGRVKECRDTLARADFMAGYFYQRSRQAYRAAVARYERILADYPDYGALDEVLYRLAESLSLAGRPNEALPHLARLLEGYPHSHLADAAQKLRATLSQPEAGQAAPPSTGASPGATTASPHSPERP